MLRYGLIYGAVPGAIVILVMIAGFALTGGEAPATSQRLGFLLMFVAFTMIFVGVKRYRDQETGGVIGFLPAFGLGVAMAAIAGVAYVAIWEVYLAISGHDFIAAYTASAIEAKRLSGASAEEIEATVKLMTGMAENYDNPFFRLPITFLEIFPVGLVVALVSALILRNPKAFPARG